MSGAVPELRFPGFVGEWEASTLGDITKISKGKGISKADIVDGGVTPCIRYGELYTTYGTVIDSVVSFTDIDARSLRMSSGGEVIIPASGETSEDIATAAVVLRPGIALGGDLNILATEQSGHFLASYISGPKRIALAGMAQGNSVVHLYPSQISTLEIALPTLAEQQKIADFLGTVDAKLDALRRKKSGLEAFKSGLMQRLFSQELRFPREDGTDFPDWDQASFGEIAERSSDKFDPRDVHEGMPVIDLENIESGTGRIINAGQSDESGSLKSLFRPGEVLFGKLRPYLRKYAQPDFDGCCSSEIWVLRGKRVSNDFLFYLIQSGRFMELATISSGSKMPRADWSIMSSAEFEIPHPDEQRKIAAALSAMDAKIAVVANQITHMETFKKGLLQQMFV